MVERNQMNSVEYSGFVYILHAEGTDRFKIGYSINPVARCYSISQQSPFPISLIHCYPSCDAATDEQRLHETFKHRRVYGEWFSFESIEHAKGLIDEFFRIRMLLDEHIELTPFSFYDKQLEKQSKDLLIAETRARLKTQWRKRIEDLSCDIEISQAAKAVYQFIIESFTGEPISARECYRKSSLRTQYGLNSETTEQILDELESFGLGEKIVEKINGFRSVRFLLNQN